MDWLVKVAENETLYPTISYLDRFLSVATITLEKLQLLRTTCLFIACKYQEVFPPNVSEFANVTDGAFSKDEIFDIPRGIF